jgi:hypothetical protein
VVQPGRSRPLRADDQEVGKQPETGFAAGHPDMLEIPADGFGEKSRFQCGYNDE